MLLASENIKQKQNERTNERTCPSTQSPSGGVNSVAAFLQIFSAKSSAASPRVQYASVPLREQLGSTFFSLLYFNIQFNAAADSFLFLFFLLIFFRLIFICFVYIFFF